MEQEKTVVLSEVSNEQANQLMQDGPRAIKGLSKAVPEFKKIEDFTTFRAEYAMIGPDLVMHFYGTPEHPNTDNPNDVWYWQTYFPNCLEEAGGAHFQASRPRVIAKYTEEMRSWFLKAQRYDHLTNIDAFVKVFCAKLDHVLEEAQLRQQAP